MLTLLVKAFRPFQGQDQRPKTTRDNLFRSKEVPKDKARSRPLTSLRVITRHSCRQRSRAMAVEAT
jgi:hypothetical protein